MSDVSQTLAGPNGRGGLGMDSEAQQKSSLKQAKELDTAWYRPRMQGMDTQKPAGLGMLPHLTGHLNSALSEAGNSC